LLSFSVYFSFDADLPIACDDEYWLHPDPEKAFKQPDGKPSKVAYFNLQLRLSQIHAYALRTIVSHRLSSHSCVQQKH
jgi:hypothetical protein